MIQRINKDMTLIPRMHEQREFPSKRRLRIDHIVEGAYIELLDWDQTTEDVDIHKRMMIENFKWTETKTHKYLTINLKNIDIKASDKVKSKIIDAIIDKHSESLRHSLVACLSTKIDEYIIDSKLTKNSIREIFDEKM